jgi:hypothetical protein
LEKKRCPACQIDTKQRLSPIVQQDNRAFFSAEPPAAERGNFGYSAAVEATAV